VLPYQRRKTEKLHLAKHNERQIPEASNDRLAKRGYRGVLALSSKSILKFPLSFFYLADGFSSFRQAFPEWCEDDNQAHNKEMESSRNVQTDQLMGLR